SRRRRVSGTSTRRSTCADGRASRRRMVGARPTPNDWSGLSRTWPEASRNPDAKSCAPLTRRRPAPNVIYARSKAPAGSREGPSPLSIAIHQRLIHHRTACCEPRLEHGGRMSSLPARPSLEQLKKQAKLLLRAAHARDQAALQRIKVLPAFAGMPASELAAIELALHDAQSVIAREHGFPSWRALREEVEARALSFDAALDEFVRCATGGRHDRAERLLELHPSIATATLPTALVLGDVSGVESRLRERP